jgi:hypothetical protein
MDSYIQELFTYYDIAVLNDKEEAFLSLFKESQEKNKFIVHVSLKTTLSVLIVKHSFT